MKLIKVFGLVIVVHAGIFGVLLVQPGCQSTAPSTSSDLSSTAEVVTVVRAPDSQEAPVDLFSEYNGGVSTVVPPSEASVAEPAELRLPPTRPKFVQTMKPAIDPVEVSPLAEESSTFVVDPLPAPVVAANMVEDEWQQYRVQPGESLWVLAKRSGVSVREIAKYNNIKPDAPLQVGQVLQLPASEAMSELKPPAVPVPDPASVSLSLDSKEYVVQSGDSLSRIAKRQGSSVKAIKALNGLSSDTIQVGQKLLIPQGDAVGFRQNVVAPKPQPAVVNSLGQDSDLLSGTVTHQVSAGENLSIIGKRYGISVKELMRLNDIQNPNRISLGQKLIIRQLESQASTKSVVAEPAKPKEVPAVEESTLLIPQKPEPLQIPDVSNLLIAPSKSEDEGATVQEEQFKEVEIIKKD